MIVREATIDEILHAIAVAHAEGRHELAWLLSTLLP